MDKNFKMPLYYIAPKVMTSYSNNLKLLAISDCIQTVDKNLETRNNSAFLSYFPS